MTTYEPPLYDHALNADELRRNLIWKHQRQQRAAYRMRVQNSLQGDPIAALMLRDKYQPLIDHALDMQAPDMGDDPETQPVTNQELNSS